MTVYLKDIPIEEAENRFFEALKKENLFGILASEVIPLDENAAGRVLAQPVWAKISSPHYHAAAMDGFALKAEETNGAMPSNPVRLKVGKQASYVDTGDAVPVWANAVVPIENTEAIDENLNIHHDIRHPDSILIREAIVPWKHIRPLGEDIVATQLVLAAGQELRAVDLGSLAASGHSKVCVSRKPAVAIIPTGTELVSVGQEVRQGEIIEYNSIMLAAQIKKWGGDAYRYSPVEDDFERLCQTVQHAANHNDLVLLNAGSSAGSEDYSSTVIEKLGEVLVHGVAARPGHPVILGMIERKGNGADDGKKIPIIGVPGYPVSAVITADIFVEPLVARWTGRRKNTPVEINARLARKITSPAGDDDYVRMVVGDVNGKLLAAPLSRGAGVITSLVRADGISIIPRGTQGLEAGDEIRVRLMRSPHDIKNTIFAIGSHDLTLDLLAQFLSERNRRLVSTNVGSLAGLLAIKRGEAHMAGSHLLDPETGEYNLSYIKKYIPDIPVKLITWVERVQGLIVRKGNPKNIQTLSELLNNDVMYINRQRGSGTRVLLDYQLSLQGIDSANIQGYHLEEYTHLAVAAAVSSGRADCGLAVEAAASALDLDFIPLFNERYDLVLPCEYVEKGFFDQLMEIINDDKFRRSVLSMPGYDIKKMGSVVIDC